MKNIILFFFIIASGSILASETFTTSEIDLMLSRAGLKLLKTSVQRKIEGKPIRMLYIARKK